MKARRPWAWPLVPLYALAVGLKSWMLRVGLLSTKRLRWPVVSVGSLSAGGAGKTPVVIALAKLLCDRGWEVDVLSRGFGREGIGVEKVDPTAPDAAERYGDEPVLIAQRVGVPVWVGNDRYEAGQRAQESSSTAFRGLHLLDDGMQHRQLARTLELVLVTAQDLQDAPIPAGNLREGLNALARADVVIVREDEFEETGKKLWEMVWAGTPIWTVRRRLVFPAPGNGANGTRTPSHTARILGAGPQPLAFCAIARPEGFAAMLQRAGCHVVHTEEFADHHRYGMGDMEKLVRLAQQHSATGFITTDKDAVKLTPPMRTALEAVGPLMVVTLEVEFANTYEVMRAIESRMA